VKADSHLGSQNRRKSLSDQEIRISYRPFLSGWDVLCSTGERISSQRGLSGDGLDHVRSAIRDHLAATLDLSHEEIEDRIGHEYVQVAEIGATHWHGLSFMARAPDFDVDGPTQEQVDQLRNCFEYYRANAPEGMRIELYANRVRLEPGAFGQRRQIIDALAARLAEQAPDDVDLHVRPTATGLDQAREQMRRAQLLPVPEGFVRVVFDLAGFEDEGDIGVMYLVLKERWRLDQPF
jgi:hypothetical protein